HLTAGRVAEQIVVDHQAVGDRPVLALPGVAMSPHGPAVDANAPVASCLSPGPDEAVALSFGACGERLGRGAEPLHRQGVPIETPALVVVGAPPSGEVWPATPFRGADPRTHAWPPRRST